MTTKPLYLLSVETSDSCELELSEPCELIKEPCDSTTRLSSDNTSPFTFAEAGLVFFFGLFSFCSVGFVVTRAGFCEGSFDFFKPTFRFVLSLNA